MPNARKGAFFMRPLAEVRLYGPRTEGGLTGKADISPETGPTVCTLFAQNTAGEGYEKAPQACK
jgi:hypothetical protein